MPETHPSLAAPSTRREVGACFRSTAHPGGASVALAYSQAMVPPLAATLIPLMLFALAAVLTGRRLWPYFFWAGPPALAVAWAWARFQMRRVPAEVCVRPAQNAAAVRSVHDVLHGTLLTWHHAARLRTEREAHESTALRLDLGDTSHRLLLDRWPEADALREALHRAVRSG